MSLTKGTKVERGYATVIGDEGVNYRDIADTMTILGYRMNHSSARNYVIRVMKKFAKAYAEGQGIEITEEAADEIAKSPMFQSGVADFLHAVEAQRRSLILRQRTASPQA